MAARRGAAPDKSIGKDDPVAISTSLPGRLRNVSLPKTNALLPLYEAVVNAIQSVDAIHEDMTSARIEVKIVRELQDSLDFAEYQQGAPLVAPILGFVVSDNGEGFHDNNLESFKTLDSEHKASLGCRGVGRLLWLKAFGKVDVVSSYHDAEGNMKERSFAFTTADGIARHTVRESQALQTGAEVRLLSFEALYRQSAPKNTRPIAKHILEHCLWYFVRQGGAPHITVCDTDERIDLDSMYEEYMVSSAQVDAIVVKEQQFELTHLRLRVGAKSGPQLNWCAANRVVREENISGKVPGLHGKLKDSEAEFMYAAFLTAPFLDQSVRAERTDFDIPEVTTGTFQEGELSRSDIRAAALQAAGQYLQPFLQEAQESGRARVENYVDHKAPRYRSIIHYIEDSALSVDPSIDDKDLELQLHKWLAELEAEVLTEGHYVLDSDNAQDEEYKKRYKDYLARVDDFKKSDLAGYVFRRRVILDLLAKEIRTNEDGKYSKEEAVHKLIMPMQVTSDDVDAAAGNLWIIDEGLAFHNFLASDKSIRSMPIVDSNSALEPDILALKVNTPFLVSEGDELPLASITVVEIKRPMRNDAGPGPDKDPLNQALRYLEQVRRGKVRTAAGRPIPRSESIPGFIYVLADLTPTVEERCRGYDLQLTQDGMGYFGYNKSYNTYIEVNSFERILNMAHQRNRAFFDQLGIPRS
jgi:hypothetical protein